MAAFPKDLIIQKNLLPEFKRRIVHLLNSSSQQNQKEIMHYLQSYLQDYVFWCKEYLKEIVPQEKEKKKIDSALKSLIPSLIGAGYSHEYIFFYCRKIFFENPVTSMDSLNIFLDRFDFHQNTYNVHFAIDKQVLAFREVLSARLMIEFDQEANARDFKYDKKHFGIIKLSTYALDESNALSSGHEKLKLFFRYYNFIGDRKDNWLHSTGKVVDENGNAAFLDIVPDGFSILTNEFPESDVAVFSGLLHQKLLLNNRTALDIISRAIDMHNVAIAEKSLTNGFLNLWSIFEILFTTNQSESKIESIEKHVLPILLRDYLHGLFDELKTYIIDNIPSKLIEELRLKANLQEQEKWFECLVLLPQYNAEREDLYAILTDQPTIRSRIYQLNRTYAQRDTALADLHRHSQRMQWHLTRLYRTRNAIIHSGRAPVHLKKLGEHLHSYVDSCLFELAAPLAFSKQLHSIEDIVINVQLKHQMLMECLQKTDDLTNSDILFIFGDPTK